MKRTAARILLFLLLGTVINVAVAWACAIWSRSTRSPSDNASVIPIELAGSVPPDWSAAPPGKPELMVHVSRHEGPGKLEYSLAMGHRRSADYYSWERELHFVRCGWPIPSVECVVVADLTAKGTWANLGSWAEWRAGSRIPQWLRPRSQILLGGFACNGALPFMPFPKGFACDTLVYAAGAWTFCWAYDRIRRQHRRRRHLCPNCAYPIGSSPVCTECGRPLNPRPAPPA